MALLILLVYYITTLSNYLKILGRDVNENVSTWNFKWDFRSFFSRLIVVKYLHELLL